MKITERTVLSELQLLAGQRGVTSITASMLSGVTVVTLVSGVTLLEQGRGTTLAEAIADAFDKLHETLAKTYAPPKPHKEI